MERALPCCCPPPSYSHRWEMPSALLGRPDAVILPCATICQPGPQRGPGAPGPWPPGQESNVRGADCQGFPAPKYHPQRRHEKLPRPQVERWKGQTKPLPHTLWWKGRGRTPTFTQVRQPVPLVSGLIPAGVGQLQFPARPTDSTLEQHENQAKIGRGGVWGCVLLLCGAGPSSTGALSFEVAPATGFFGRALGPARVAL